MAVPRLSLLKDGDEHRRYVLQTVLGFRAVEKGGMRPQFIGHLVNNEGAAWSKSVVCILEESAFLLISRMLKGMPRECNRTADAAEGEPGETGRARLIT